MWCRRSALNLCGMSDESDQGKPVLMANGALTPTRTPAVARDADGQEVVTTGEVHDDGSIDAVVRVMLTSQPAVSMREAFRRASRDEAERYVKQALKGMGFDGEGTIAYPDPQPLEAKIVVVDRPR